MDKASGDACRKLLLGDLVEVRQKEIGLRGSWHPARVVRVKHGRRVVEYDDLLTSDQSRKLQESIHLSCDTLLQSTSLREKKGTKATPEKRSFIRPRPPSCLMPPPKNWKRGLLVDAFYDDAWWEGILLDDVHFCHGDFKVKVFFPEEGDELRILISDLRVSQEWDEDSGEWAVRGYWTLHSEMGKNDLSSLKEMYRTRRSSLKRLWRQKRFNLLEMLEQGESQSLGTPASHIQLDPFAGIGAGTASEERRVLAQKETVLQEITTNTAARAVFENSDEDVVTAVNTAEFSGSPGHVLKIFQEEMNEKHISTCTDVDATEQQCLNEHCNKKIRGKLKGKLAENRRISTRMNARSSATVNAQGTDKFTLPEATKGNSKDFLEVNHMPEEEKLPPASLAEKLSMKDWQLSDLSIRNDVSSGVEQADHNNDGSSPANRGSIPKSQSQHVQNDDSRCNGVGFADYSVPHKVRVRQARLAAKQFLLDAGWTLDVRNRARGPLTRQEVVYISPNGSRFFSLAAACRGWKSHDSHDEIPSTCMNKGIELLSTYYMSEDLRYVQTLCSQQENTKEMLMPSRLREGDVGVSQADCKVSGLSNSAMDITDAERNSVEFSSFLSIQAGSGCQGDTRVKKKKFSQSAENQKKRKSEVLEGLSPSEVRRKRSRPPSKRGGCRMQVLLSYPGKNKDLGLSKSAGELSQFKKSTVLSWLMDKGVLKENEPVSYINKKDGHVMKKGHVTREGVICDCCNEVFTLSNFEAHAGSKLHRPSANTFLDDGRSISDCQLEACALQDVKEKEGLMDISDDTCGVCGDGGELVLCDHCPSTFHAVCIGLEIIPEGDWYCPRCCCGICGSNQLSAHDVDGAMHRCEQCELEYHLICAQGHTALTICDAETSIWFCDKTCKEIFTALRTLVGISNSMGDGFFWTLLRSMKKDKGLSASSLEEMAEYHSKLSVAHGVMQECFVPMIDPRTNINLLSQAIYNRRSKVTRLNYVGFYTMILERGDEIISVATIRIHGARLAEMPLVGTRYQYRRQGMCRRLMQALEEMLRSIGVEKLILPAVPELLDTWMGSFNFIKISPEETRELSKLSLMTFPGTTLLQKHLPASMQAKKPPWLSHLVDKVDSAESLPCNSVEAFLRMARASLDSGVLNCGKSFIATALNGSGQDSSAKFNVVDHLQKSDHQYLSVDPQTPVTVEAARGSSHVFVNGGKFKNRLKSRDHVESSGNGLIASKVQKDDDIYTSVVITTTRSNRLVKSRRWVADGLKELKSAKQSKRTFVMSGTCSEPEIDSGCSKLFETLVHSNIGQDGQNVETVYVRTRRRTPISVESAEVRKSESNRGRDWFCKSVVDSVPSGYQDDYSVAVGLLGQQGKSTDLTNVDEDSCGNHAMDGLCVDRLSLNFEGKDELPICENFYSRRKKRESVHTDLTRGFAEIVTAEQSMERDVCAPIEGPSQGLRTCSVASETPCKLLGGIAE